MSQAVDKFKEIRPYNDCEVRASLKRLIDDREFISLIAQYNLPKWARPFKFLLHPFIQRHVAKKWAHINTVEQVQDEVAQYLEKVIKNTTSKVTYSGLDKLDKNQAYLFISNHRDIALDPAFVNWGLYRHGMKTVRIAIGDNLLQVPFITELMKLNKSFIVKRSAKAPKEMLKALSQLSEYVYDSLSQGQSIWIAQREGRTKDGDDKTDPALLKMLQLKGRKLKMNFSDYIRELKVVPVAISYEYEPCDVAKAKELYQKANHGRYEKAEGEDIASIMEGFSSFKGHVHVAFGEPVDAGCETPEELAQTIDEQVTRSFYLHPLNYIAANECPEKIKTVDKEMFNQRMAEVPEELRSLVVDMYARPVRKLEKA